jgi:hypothetical protein
MGLGSIVSFVSVFVLPVGLLLIALYGASFFDD